MKFFRLLVLTCFLIQGMKASASDNFYVRGDFQNILPSKLTDYQFYNKKSIKNSYGYGFGVGYDFKKFRADISLQRIGKMKFSHHIVYGNSDYNAEQNLSSTVVMLNGFVDFFKVQNFATFFTAGLGYASNKAGNYNVVKGQYQNGDRTDNLAWKLGLGTSYNLNKNVSFDFSYSYMYLNQYKTSDLIVVSTGTFYNPIAPKTRLAIHGLNLGVRYNF